MAITFLCRSSHRNLPKQKGPVRPSFRPIVSASAESADRGFSPHIEGGRIVSAEGHAGRVEPAGEARPAACRRLGLNI